MKLSLAKQILPLLAVVILSGMLSACGKRGTPVPPSDAPSTYPKVYPSDNK